MIEVECINMGGVLRRYRLISSDAEWWTRSRFEYWNGKLGMWRLVNNYDQRLKLSELFERNNMNA